MSSRPANEGLARWHRVVKEANPALLDGLLAESCQFHSPVLLSPQKGKELTKFYLTAAFKVLVKPPANFRYVREVVGASDAVLEFETEVDGIKVNGVDMIKWNAEGLIVDFKVMVRPHKAIEVLRKRMASELAASAKL